MMTMQAWQRRTARVARVGAVAQRDPSLPWTDDEIKQRIWTLEQRADTERTLNILLLGAVGVAGIGLLAVAAAAWGRR